MKTNPARFVLSVVKFLGTPLFIATLLAAMVAITRAREGHWDQAALAASIALACGGAGVAASRWVRLHARGAGPSERLRAANPDAPWMWREDWAAGEVRTSVRDDADRLTILAIAWCVVTLPIVFIAPHRALRHADYSALPSLIFPLIGIAMLAWAMRLRRRLREYGESRFTLGSMPGQIGGSLIGSIHIDHPLPAGQQVALELECINRTTRGAWHNLNGLGPDFVALRSNFDERFDGIDTSRVHDSSRLPSHRRLQSQQPNHLAAERARWRISR